MTPMTTPADEMRAGSSPLERRALKRRQCAWCDALLLASRCQAMFGRKCTDVQMKERRDRALASYKPRARAALMENAGEH